MSHPINDDLLEGLKEAFDSAKTKDSRQAVVERLREEGFNSQADYLEQFVEDGGIDRSDELRERAAFDNPEEKK